MQGSGLMKRLRTSKNPETLFPGWVKATSRILQISRFQLNNKRLAFLISQNTIIELQTKLQLLNGECDNLDDLKAKLNQENHAQKHWKMRGLYFASSCPRPRKVRF